MEAPKQATLSHSELPPVPPDSLFHVEWELYRREVGRLIAEGHEGKWLLIKGETILGLFDTEDQALEVRAQRFFRQPVLVKQILSREPLRCSFPRYNWTTPDSPHSIHYTQLPAAPPESLFRTEWELYRREVGRLIAEGHEGKWLLIKGETVIGLFDTEDQALEVRAQRFFRQPVMVQRIRVREPVLQITPRDI